MLDSHLDHDLSGVPVDEESSIDAHLQTGSSGEVTRAIHRGAWRNSRRNSSKSSGKKKKKHKRSWNKSTEDQLEENEGVKQWLRLEQWNNIWYNSFFFINHLLRSIDWRPNRVPPSFS